MDPQNDFKLYEAMSGTGRGRMNKVKDRSPLGIVQFLPEISLPLFLYTAKQTRSNVANGISRFFIALLVSDL